MAATLRVGVATSGLIALLLLAGCAQIAVHSTVAADATIEEYRMEITTSRTVYGLIEQSAQEEGFDSVEESLLRDLDLDEVGAESVEYDEEFDGDEVTMIVTMTGVDPAEFDNVSVTEEDGRLVYEDRTFAAASQMEDVPDESDVSDTVAAGLAVDYYLTMPGEIVDSNADEVDGNTAEWHATGTDAFTDTRIYAESELPTTAPVPGFGHGVAVLAIGLLVAALVVASHRRD